MTTNVPPGAGPDGSNILGFLCAVGVFSTLHRLKPNSSLRMSWTFDTGWRPHFFEREKRIDLTKEVDAFQNELTSASNRERFLVRVNHWIKDPKKKPSDGLYRNPDQVSSVDYAVLAKNVRRASYSRDRFHIDFIGAFAGQTHTDQRALVEATYLCALGSSQQYFFKTMQQLSQMPGQPLAAKKGKPKAPKNLGEDPATYPDHLQAALTKVWAYAHPAPAMRWDSAEDRQHALRSLDPTDGKSPIFAERGANRLAIEALPLYPTAPGPRGLKTGGFHEEDGRYFFSWPIWTCRLSLGGLKTLLTQPEINRPKPRREFLAPLGVEEVFRSERIQKGRQRNFSVAMPILR